EVERTEAEQLKIVLRRSRQETHISQHGGSSTDKGTGSKPRVLDVPSDDSEEEISWNSSDDEDQESSSVSSFVTSMLNPISGAGVESTFTTASSPITPIQTSTPIMTPSTIAIITTLSDAPIPPTITSSAVLQNLLTFNSRRRECGEPESASTPFEPETRSVSRSTIGTQSRQMSSSKSTFAEEPVQTTCQMDEPPHSVFEIVAEDQPIVQTFMHPEWFSQPRKPPTPDRDWNKTLPAVYGSAQTWIRELAKQADSHSSFNELLDTPLDFSNFIMNRLCVDTLTLELMARPTYELMWGSCTSLTELEYHLEEVYKGTTDQLDWVNPEGQQYPHNLLQPLPLITDNRGRRVIPFAHFINNDLEYLRRGASSRKYTTSMTKTKAADYGHIKWIEDMVPRTMWIQELLNYDKHALWGVSHWRQKRQQFYGFAVNQEFAFDVYSKRRIIAVTDLKIVEWHNYKHLDWIS
nr:hypothetical protein [Tanacetum cinerariifolium]